MDLHSLYKSLIPTNARVLGESLLGNTSPITNADFTPQELEELHRMYLKKKAHNDYMANLPKNIPTESRYMQQPNLRSGPNGLEPVPYSEAIDKIYQRAAPYLKDPNKTSLGYADYTTGGATDPGILGSLRNLYDPSYNAQTTVGSANVYTNPDGTATLRDVYDFDRGANSNGGLRDMLENWLVNNRKISRPVQLDFPK